MPYQQLRLYSRVHFIRYKCSKECIWCKQKHSVVDKSVTDGQTDQQMDKVIPKWCFISLAPHKHVSFTSYCKEVNKLFWFYFWECLIPVKQTGSVKWILLLSDHYHNVVFLLSFYSFTHNSFNGIHWNFICPLYKTENIQNDVNVPLHFSLKWTTFLHSENSLTESAAKAVTYTCMTFQMLWTRLNSFKESQTLR